MSVDKQLPSFDDELRGGEPQAERTVRTDTFLDMSLLVKDALQQQPVADGVLHIDFVAQTPDGGVCTVEAVDWQYPEVHYTITPVRKRGFVPHNSAYERERIYLSPMQGHIGVAYGEQVANGRTTLWGRPFTVTDGSQALADIAQYVSTLVYGGPLLTADNTENVRKKHLWSRW